MESEQVSSCCSSSTPSPPSSSSAGDSSPAKDAAYRTEMEAAEALADLAQLAIMREKVVESAAKWGSKGKRVRKRVKNESPPCDSRLKPADSELPAPDLAEERMMQEEQDDVARADYAKAVSRDLTIVPVKTEVDGKTPKQVVGSGLRCRSSGNGRSRKNLSEAEKEERKIRRILANRESARRTIRRRQALSEELSKKASDLSYENAQLKREKDRSLKEFHCLETLNKHLKEQLSRTVTPEAKEPEETSKVSQVETSTCAPFYCYNQHPFQLLCWPPLMQSSNSAALPQNGLRVPPATSAGASSKISPSLEHEKPANDEGPKPPFFIVPCPWFLPPPPPPPGQSNGVHSVVTDGMKNAPEDRSSNGHHSHNSPTRPVHGSKRAVPSYDLNESASEIPSEGGDARVMEFHHERHRLSGGPSHFFKHEDPGPPGHHVLSSLPEKNQGFTEYSSKRLVVDAVAAAEARKRRRELTRLKNLHGRQCRMQV